MAATVTGLEYDCPADQIRISGTGFVDGATITLQNPDGDAVPFTRVSLTPTVIVLDISTYTFVAGSYCVSVTNPIAPLLLTGPSDTAMVGTPYVSAVVATGGTPPYTYATAAGTLPDGLTLDTGTGIITGTPTVDGTVPITSAVVDADTQTALNPVVIDVAVTGDTPLSRSEHPRLWFTAADVAGIQSKLAGGTWTAEFQAFVDYLNGQTLAQNKSNSQTWLPLAAGYAFVAQTYGVAGVTYGGNLAAFYSGRAHTLFVDFIALYNVMQCLSGWAAALTYDWAYTTFSAAEKPQAVALFRSADPGLCAATQVFNTAAAGGRANKVMGALALLGDGSASDTAWATATIDAFGTSLFRGTTGITSSESYISGATGGGAEGFVYWNFVDAVGSINVVQAAEEAYRTAEGLSLATHYGTSATDVLRYHPQMVASAEAPFNYAAASGSALAQWALWRSWAGGAVETIYNAAAIFMELAAHVGIFAAIDSTMAGMSQWLLTNRVTPPLGLTSSYYAGYVLPYFILGRHDVTPVTPSTVIPLSERRTHEGYFLRTGWTTADTEVIVATPRWATDSGAYMNRRPGSFMVWRKGIQVTESGAFGHEPAEGGTWSRNILTFPDATLTTPASAFDTGGAARFLVDASHGAVDLVADGRQDFRGASASLLTDYLASDGGAGRDVDYIRVDLTRSYDSTTEHDIYNPARISSYVREFVWFRSAVPGTDPERCVILDRATTTDTKYEKRWLYHPAMTNVVTGPTVTGQSSTVAGPSRGLTGTGGKTTYVDATLVTGANVAGTMSGSSFLTPLLPASRNVVVVGGPNSSAVSWQNTGCANSFGCAGSVNDSHETEDAYGHAMGVSGIPSAQYVPFAGAWRVEVIPGTPALADTFLNVVEVADAGGSPSTTVLVSGTNCVGARVGNRYAIFGAAATWSTGSFKLPTAGTYKVLVANFTGPTRALVGGANITSIVTAEGATSSPFTVASAGVIYLTIVVNTNGTGAANTVTVS